MTTDIPRHSNYVSRNRFPPSDDDLSMVTLLNEDRKKSIHEKINAILHKCFYREKERFQWK